MAKKHFRKSLFFRVFGLLIALSIFTILLFAVMVIPREKQAFLDSLLSQAHSLSASISEVSANAFVSGDYGFIVDHNIQVIKSSQDIYYIIVVRHDGLSLIHTQDRWEQKNKPDPSWTSAEEVPQGKMLFSKELNKEVYHYSFPLNFSGIEWGILHLGLSLNQYNKQLKSMYSGILLMSVICFFISIFVAYFFTRQITKPVLTLRQVTDTIMHGDLTARAEIKTNDEVEDLAKSFNQMTDKLLQKQHDLEKAKEEAENANKAKSEFLANMSHEIRTPLNGILGVLDLLSGSNIDNQQKKLITTAYYSAETLLAIINDILDFSKIEAGKMELNNTNFNLEKEICDVMTVFKLQADNKNIKIDYEITDDVPIKLYADIVRIRQALINLIGNAIKFTQEGEVFVKCSLLKEEKHKALLKFEIKDTGIGIPSNLQDSIFSPFLQADTSTTRKFSGTGLGLAISRQIVDMFNGEIGFESEVGKGSTFWCTLTVEKQDISEQDGTPISSTIEVTTGIPGENKDRINAHILLAEDNPINRQVIEAILEDIGCTFDSVENGEEVLDMISKKRYDIIFMDCQMPIMDGYETSRKIREKEQKKLLGYSEIPRIPIIAITAHALSEDKEKCLASGMDDYLSKPFKMSQVIDILKKWLSKK
jgi:signal transduction histidine kinase